MKPFISLLALILVITRTYATVTYKVDNEYPGTTQAEFTITGEQGAWTIELRYDNKVTLNVSITNIKLNKIKFYYHSDLFGSESQVFNR